MLSKNNSDMGFAVKRHCYTVLDSNIAHEPPMNDKKSLAMQIGERVRIKRQVLNMQQETLVEILYKPVNCIGN